jgi:hypothetical protein
LSVPNLPLPFPVTPSAARRINSNAVAENGVMLVTAAYERWNVDIQLPGAWEALQDWAGDHGYRVSSRRQAATRRRF